MSIKTLIDAEDIVSQMSEEDGIVMDKVQGSNRVLREANKEPCRQLVWRTEAQDQLVRTITKMTRR